MKKYISIILVFCLIVSEITIVYSDPASDLKNAQLEEQKIVLELFNLDMEKARSLRLLDQINMEIINTNEKIDSMEREISSLNQDIVKERNNVKSWFRFLYMNGTNTILSLLLMSNNASELLHRLIYIDIITNYFYSKLDHINYLLKNKKSEEEALNNQRNDLKKKLDEQKNLVFKIEQLESSKRAMLVNIKRQINDYQKILSLSESLETSIPSLDFLLNNISKLPWDSLQPDNINIQFDAVSASFSDVSISNMIDNYDVMLKNVKIAFDDSGFTLIDGDNYTLKGIFKVDGGKINFNIESITIKSVEITGEYLNNLIKNYKTVLNFESPLKSYKLDGVETTNGEVKFTLIRQ
ncbi:coiled-coil domain-containing protein [Thermoanaerobacterium thermosaccharolyticum]|uniref:coiled-coil domain-containing protein n=1 Tax=Thermoanaerobacterium thermosaccharolyticum TaxID=1517 RepID=UPI003DAA0DA1